MRISKMKLALLGPLAALTVATHEASALNTEDFFRICEMGKVPCNENQLLNAYIGGALDLVASLDENTDYLQTIYCEDPRELFDIPSIVAYMDQHRQEYANRNAMMLLIRYLEEHGGC